MGPRMTSFSIRVQVVWELKRREGPRRFQRSVRNETMPFFSARLGGAGREDALRNDTLPFFLQRWAESGVGWAARAGRVGGEESVKRRDRPPRRLQRSPAGTKLFAAVISKKQETARRRGGRVVWGGRLGRAGRSNETLPFFFVGGKRREGPRRQKLCPFFCKAGGGGGGAGGCSEERNSALFSATAVCLGSRAAGRWRNGPKVTG